MAVGDEYRYSNGNTYVVTDAGPVVMWRCDDCGAPAATCFEYTGIVRCSGCWPKFHGIGINNKKGAIAHGRA